MAAKSRIVLVVALVVGLAVGLVGGVLSQRPATANDDAPAKGGAFPRYTVVGTEGHNLVVTDNQTNALYFYSIDRDAKLGEDLKLRAKFDLGQVGEKTIRPQSFVKREK